MSQQWSSPIDMVDVLGFRQQTEMEAGWGKQYREEEVTLTFAYRLAPSNVGSASAPLEVDVIAAAVTQGTTEPSAAGPTDLPLVQAPSWLTSKTKNPTMGDQNKLTPTTQRILICGLAVDVAIPPPEVALEMEGAITPDRLVAPTAALDLIHGVQRAFDASVLQLTQGDNRYKEIRGLECISYGSSRVGDVVPGPGGEEAPGFYAGHYLHRDRGWRRLVPVVVGPGEQLGLYHLIPRATAWPIGADDRILVTVEMPSVIHVRTGKGSDDVNAPSSRC